MNIYILFRKGSMKLIGRVTTIGAESGLGEPVSNSHSLYFALHTGKILNPAVLRTTIYGSNTTVDYAR